MSADNANTSTPTSTPAASHEPKVKMLTTTNAVGAGDACTTADGRSGYMVAVGNKLVCQAG